jgi:hypothetical protein
MSSRAAWIHPGVVLAGLWIAAASAVAAPPDARHTGRTLRQEVPLGAARTVRIDLRYGEVHVEPGESGNLEAELWAHCSHGWGHCDERLERIQLVARPHGDVLEIRVEDLPQFGNHGIQCDLRVRVPAHQALDIDVGAGEVHVADVQEDVQVHLGAGAIEVRMPEAAVHTVEARAGVGEAHVRGTREDVEERRHLVGGVARWNAGEGAARVDCHVGAGEIEVRLQ